MQVEADRWRGSERRGLGEEWKTDAGVGRYGKRHRRKGVEGKLVLEDLEGRVRERYEEVKEY